MRLLNNKYGNPHYLLASYRKEIKALPSVKPGDASGFRKFYSFVLKCKTFSKSTGWNTLEIPKHSTFLFQSYLVALGIDGTERYRWLEEILKGNHVYLILPVLFMKKTSSSMILSFRRMLYWSMFRLLKGKMKKKKRNMEVLLQKREK